MALSGHGEFGVWEATAPAAIPLPTLHGALDAEIAIVGAGYTGLSTALHLAELGTKAVVLEAEVPGFGASGRNAGWLEPEWWLKKPADIVAAFGADRAERLTRWLASGPQLLASWVAKHRMSVGLNRCGLMLATDQPAKARALEAMVDAWQRLGVNIASADAAEVRKHVATRRYCGGVFLRDGATLNPLALTRELARVCVSQGVALFASTPVMDMTLTQGRWHLTTPRGTVRAQRLVLATDAYTRALLPTLAGAMATWHLAVVGSEPYPTLADLLPTGRAFGDLGMSNMFTLRSDSDGRLVTSTYAPVRRSLAPAVVAEPFMRKFRKVFAGHTAPRWTHLHYGEVGLSRDMLPRLCAIGEQAWTAYGYSGNGVNTALLMGGELARRVTADSTSMGTFPVTRLEVMPLRRAIGWGLKYLHAPLARGVISRLA